MRGTPVSSRRAAECACGQGFTRPWELVGHLLAIYPPYANEQLDDKTHGDRTVLSVKLAEGPTEIWDMAAWACSPSKGQRVAASIAMKSAVGELSPGEQIGRYETHQTYRVSTYAAGTAISRLRAIGILGRYGSFTNVNPRYLVERKNANQRAERILHLVAIHVTNLEAMGLAALTGRLETERCVRERPERET
jgi:hypothetical protein